MNAYPEKQHYTADDLAAIIAILRDPDNGCRGTRCRRIGPSG